MKPHIHPARVFLHYLPLFLVIPPCICISIHTMTTTQLLRDGDLLLSKESNKFALGFFNPPNSKLRYVGVWYHSIPEQTVVWVLNRDNPVNDTSGVLSIDTSGNLLLRQGNSHIWHTNVSISSPKATAAQLLNTGNLVLVEDRRVVWQGFDYPTDTLIPYMKIGLDRRTGFNWFLTSWKSLSNPGTGKYSAWINASGCPQVILYGGSERLWRTGHWNGLHWSGLPDMTYLSMLNTSFVNNEDEIYEMFTMLNSSILSRLTIGSDGYVQRFIWHESEGKWSSFFTSPKDRCDRYGRCGPNGNCDNSGPDFECRCLVGFEPKSPRDWNLRDGTEGCLRKEGAKVCRSGEGFVKVNRAKPPETSMARVNMSISLEECREECLKDCSCSAYAAANVSGSGSGCLSWYGDLVDTRILSAGGQDFYVRVDATTLAENEEQSKDFLAKKGMMRAVLVVGAALIMVLLLSSFCFLRKEMKGKGRQSKMLNSLGLSTWLQDASGEKEHEESTTHSKLHFFDLNTLVVATNSFSSENKLGRGGFGSVYKGQLCNGQEIAVKRLSTNSGQGKKEFINEVTVIAKLQHRNLVRLLGCCIQGEEKMLVYEYLPNKSLDSCIFDETKKHLLDWRKRFEIIIGIARGILYLHHDSRLRIIHRDLKAGNVLLDAEMLPKISDFGLAKTFEGNQIEGNTKRVVGTYGYMSPEYAMEGLFSTKSDIYSFGVLLLEIISGRKNNSYYEDSLFLNLVGHVWKLWQEEKALNIIDPSLETSYLADEVLRCIQIGLLCVQELAVDRPTMLTVVFMLGSNSSLPFPKQPGYISNKIPTNENVSSSGEGLLSFNEVTQTSIQAR